MAIEQTSAISALTQVTNRDPQDTTVPMRIKVSADEIVKESSFAPSELQKLLQPQASDINSAKVEQIKQAIKDGTLTMDAEKLLMEFCAMPMNVCYQ